MNTAWIESALRYGFERGFDRALHRPGHELQVLGVAKRRRKIEIGDFRGERVDVEAPHRGYGRFVFADLLYIGMRVESERRDQPDTSHRDAHGGPDPSYPWASFPGDRSRSPR